VDPQILCVTKSINFISKQ